MPNFSIISVELFLLTSESFICNKGISVEEIFQEILTLIIKVNTSERTEMNVLF